MEQLKILEIALDCINNNKNLTILKDQFSKKSENVIDLKNFKK